MTIYFMGGEVGSFTPTTSQQFESASVGYNSAWARGAMEANDTGYFESLSVSLPDDFWFHADLGLDGGIGSGTTLTQYVAFAASGTEMFRIVSSGDNIRMQALVSSVWTNVGAITSAPMISGPVRCDMHVVGNSGTGTATLYIEGVEITSATADLSAVTGITTVRCYGKGYGAGMSQVILADEPTIGWRLATYYPSGTGANTAWTGDYTSVDELRYSDADFIYSGTANQVETFTATGPTLTGYTVRGVGVYCRARRGASGPQNLQLALRVNGTDHFSGSKALGLGYASFGHIWEDNPDTTVDWLASQIAAIQPGVKSIA